MSTAYGGGAYSPPPQINFNWISEAWELFRAQMGAWIVALLLYFVVLLAIGTPLAFVTGYAGELRDIMGGRGGVSHPGLGMAYIGSNLLFGLLLQAVNVLMLGGLYRMAIRQVRGETIAATDIFSALDMAVPLLITGILTQIIVTIGTYLCLLPGLAAMGLLMFAPLLVIDRKLGPIPAMSESFALLKSQWLMATLFYIVVVLIAELGLLALGVGILFTMPLMFISVALGYLTFTGQRPGLTPDYGTAQPGVWPPPPSASPPPENWPPPPGV